MFICNICMYISVLTVQNYHKRIKPNVLPANNVCKAVFVKWHFTLFLWHYSRIGMWTPYVFLHIWVRHYCAWYQDIWCKFFLSYGFICSKLRINSPERIAHHRGRCASTIWLSWHMWASCFAFRIIQGQHEVIIGRNVITDLDLLYLSMCCHTWCM